MDNSPCAAPKGEKHSLPLPQRGVAWDMLVLCFGIFKSREGLFFKTAVSVAHLMKRQNCEGLETEMAKRGLERRPHPALLGHFCFQRCCYLHGSVPDGDHSVWTVTGS